MLFFPANSDFFFFKNDSYFFLLLNYSAVINCTGTFLITHTKMTKYSTILRLKDDVSLKLDGCLMEIGPGSVFFSVVINADFKNVNE